MQNDIKPVPGNATDKAIPQAGQAMVVPAVPEIPGTVEENAKTGGRIFTQGFEQDETRPQDLHGAVAYQQATADPGKTPQFIAYTDLTTPRSTVRG
jgi:hypothetical protein